MADTPSFAPDQAVKILIVDDHRLLNECLKMGLSQFTEFNVVAQAYTGREAVNAVHDLQPDVVLMDICMPELDGIQATGEIKMAYPHIKVIMTSSLVERDAVKLSFAAQADGYCTKDNPLEQLQKVIKAVLCGATWLDPAIARFVIEEMTMSASQAQRLQSEPPTLPETFISKTTKPLGAPAVPKPLPVLQERPTAVPEPTEYAGFLERPQEPQTKDYTPVDYDDLFGILPSQAVELVSVDDCSSGELEPYLQDFLNQSYSDRNSHAFENFTAPAGTVYSGSGGVEEESSVKELLSEKELTLLKHIADNRTNDEIAELMKISTNWISTYIQTILQKLAVTNEIQAIRKAMQDGVIVDAAILNAEY